jgi:hypothetical protein
MFGQIRTKRIFTIVSIIGLVIYLFNNCIQSSDNTVDSKYSGSIASTTQLIQNQSGVSTVVKFNTVRAILIVTSAKHVNSEITKIFDRLRFKYKVLDFKSKLEFDKYFRNNPRHSVLIFEYYDDYMRLTNEQTHDIDGHLDDIGIVVFMRANKSRSVFLNECKLNLNQNLNETFFFVTKPNGHEITVNTSVQYASFMDEISSGGGASPVFTCNHDLPMVSITKRDSIDFPRVFIGLNIADIWIMKLLFLDALVFASRGRLAVDLKRYIQIDIDDIFVGGIGTRLKVDDVNALEQLQSHLADTYFERPLIRNAVDNQGKSFHYAFKFNLGYSGHYYKSGNSDENLADELLLRKLLFFVV